MKLEKAKSKWVNKRNNIIYHFENYIQMQKQDFKNFLQQWWTNPPGRKNQDIPYDRNKMGH